MTAKLTINFEDGSTKEISLGEKLVVIDTPDEGRNPLALMKKPSGAYHLSYTKPLMEGKKWQSITINKI